MDVGDGVDVSTLDYSDPEDCRRGLLHLILVCPGIAPDFSRWAGVRLVTEEEHDRLMEEALRTGRDFRSDGPYLGWSFVWVGSRPKDGIAARCGARTRKGTPCQARVVEGKRRCRCHGGRSTGPKTAKGRARIAESNRRRAKSRRNMHDSAREASP